MKKHLIKYEVKELQALSKTIEKIGKSIVLPQLEVSMQQAANYIRSQWIGYISGDIEVPGLDRYTEGTSEMVRSIRAERQGTLHWRVSSNNRKMEELQEGAAPVIYDMKKTHPYGKKSRVSKQGVPYLIIPFRWGTPNSKGGKRARFNNVIPQIDYNMIKKGFQMSAIKPNTKIEVNYKGEDIERQTYTWGDRLKDSEDNRAIGLVRMKDRDSNKSAGYWTFRIISAKSPAHKWWYMKQGKEGVDFLGKIIESSKSKVDEMIKEGLKNDL